jgi:phosphatidylinositol glycan class M
MSTSRWNNAIFQPTRTVGAAILMRVVLLVYGHYQDQHSALKYTDIDYYVFTDASRYVSHGDSPYTRDTYRYTPLLAWLLLPTAWSGFWFDFGKVLFAGSDVIAGYLIYAMLISHYNMSAQRALQYASIWLLNPMVAQISTRGSSEGLLAVMVMGLLWACLNQQWSLAGIMLGVSVHFKIYPFIYAAAIIWWLDESQTGPRKPTQPSEHGLSQIVAFVNVPRLKIIAWSLVTFVLLNIWMFYVWVRNSSPS